jgi:prefoldin subunit 5
MNEKKMLKAIEILAGRVLELENDLTVSQYRIDKLKEIIEKAESEAGQQAQ